MRRVLVSFMMLGAAAVAMAQAPSAPSAPEAPGPPEQQEPAALVEFPHPLITEVLYAVPWGAAGDANGDGSRDAVGDEFVELINPHDRPIDLRGYIITDREQKSSRDGTIFTSVRFVFPALVLQPGEVVVVFNGHEQRWSGPVGDSARAAARNPRFANARVLTMGNTSPRSAFANPADCVVLWSPEGKPLHAVRWGEAGSPAEAPAETRRVEEAPLVRGASVARMTITGPLVEHSAHAGPAGRIAKNFSPGIFPPARQP